MQIVKCKCGHYKVMDENLCMVCGSKDKFMVPENQTELIELWNQYNDEHEFNKYMYKVDHPDYVPGKPQETKEFGLGKLFKWGFIILFTINMLWWISTYIWEIFG